MTNKKKPWLQPNVESEAQKAQRKRVAKEQSPSLADTIAKLDEELEKAKSKTASTPPAPTIAAAPASTPAPRTTPRLIRDDPAPVPVSERHTPVAVGEPARATTAKDDDVGQPKAAPDPHLVELAKLWPALTEAQRMQLVMFAKVMIHVGK